MIGKKDTIDIFKQYRKVLLEQKEDGGVSDIINKINASSLDAKSKELLSNLLKNENVARIFATMSSQQPVGDADSAGYASYPEAEPANSPNRFEF